MYFNKSTYVTIENNEIGYGLFCSTVIPAQTRFVTFIGKLRSNEEFNQRTTEGKGGYGIKVNKSTVLDCYDEAKATVCMASMGNSPLHLFGAPKENATLVIKGDRAYLVSLDIIYPHTEILYKYGSIFKFF